jgi:hypothetical protein
VGVIEVADLAGVSVASVRAQLAGLTMLMRNPNYGVQQQNWPVHVAWMAGGFASYSMDPELAADWRELQNETTPYSSAMSAGWRRLTIAA